LVLSFVESFKHLDDRGAADAWSSGKTLLDDVKAQWKTVKKEDLDMVNNIQEGVRNLIAHCAEVQKGDEVLILNEYGKIDPDVADSITTAVKNSGAECHVLWGEGVERDRTSLPKVLVGAMLSARKVIVNCALNRAIVDEYTAGKGLVQINNTARTPALMGSSHARYHWGIVRAIYGRLEEMFSEADRWVISSPAGTEISGRIGKESEIADAYFSEEGARARFIRVFPGEVYRPVGSVNSHGIIVVEYINLRDQTPWEETATISIKNNEIVDINGSERARSLEKTLDERSRKYGAKAMILDSWHGGMNPKARVPTKDDKRLQGATSGPALMHFHLGQYKEPISAGILNPTIELNGKKIYDNGKLMILDDPKIQEAVQCLGAGVEKASV
jgi:hypothetical protein